MLETSFSVDVDVINFDVLMMIGATRRSSLTTSLNVVTFSLLSVDDDDDHSRCFIFLGTSPEANKDLFSTRQLFFCFLSSSPSLSMSFFRTPSLVAVDDLSVVLATSASALRKLSSLVRASLFIHF